MIIYYDQIDSTNRAAKELAYQGKPSGTVVQAGMQSSGKGQHGRSFSSPPGGLYFSLLLQPDLRIEDLPLVTLAVGLACRDVFAAAFSLHAQIKWPNDIYLKGKKLAGILCENIFIDDGDTMRPKLIIGVGVNANSSMHDFPKELQAIVTTLREHLQYMVDLQTLLILLLKTITEKVELLKTEKNSLIGHWKMFDYLYGKTLLYTDSSTCIKGKGKGIATDGRYRFQDEQGNEHIVIAGQFRPLSDSDEKNE